MFTKKKYKKKLKKIQKFQKKLPKKWNKFYKQQSQPMSQITYWVLFIACAVTYTIGIVTGAAFASYNLISFHPEIGTYSWLVQGIWF